MASSSGQIKISSSHIVLEYELVFDCKTEVILGVGIVSATPNAQEVVEGDTCTFSATLENNWRFVGWYENSDFSGTPVSTNQIYTATITKNIMLPYQKMENLKNGVLTPLHQHSQRLVRAT